MCETQFIENALSRSEAVIGGPFGVGRARAGDRGRRARPGLGGSPPSWSAASERTPRCAGRWPARSWSERGRRGKGAAIARGRVTFAEAIAPEQLPTQCARRVAVAGQPALAQDRQHV